MWHNISCNDDLIQFMDVMVCFHDSCIKEISYISGAYVNEDLSMYPINNCRVLRLIIQRQYEKNSMVEMEFQGLIYLKLFPSDENYTCEILDSTMLFKNGYIYWCDCGNLTEDNIDNYEGTIICASRLRWRSINNCMGDKVFFCSDA